MKNIGLLMIAMVNLICSGLDAQVSKTVHVEVPGTLSSFIVYHESRIFSKNQ